MERKGILLVVSGFSGAGKGTLMKNLVETYDNYALSISMTTRKPREGEEEGKAYFFVEEEEFLQKIKEGKVIEYIRDTLLRHSQGICRKNASSGQGCDSGN